MLLGLLPVNRTHAAPNWDFSAFTNFMVVADNPSMTSWYPRL